MGNEISTVMLEKMGIHIVTEEERNKVLQWAEADLQTMDEIRKLPPEETSPQSYSVKIHMFPSEMLEPQKEVGISCSDLLVIFICDLTGYHSAGSDERLFLKEWLLGFNHKKLIAHSTLLDKEGPQRDFTYRIKLNKWQIKKMDEVAKSVALTVEQLIEAFFQEVAGYRYSDEESVDRILKWLHRSIR